MYRSEEEMYPDVLNWLKGILEDKVKNAKKFQVYNTSRTNLAKLLSREHLAQYFDDEFLTYEIKVDVTGVIIKRDNRAELVFVECKLNKITFRDFCQLLGYSIVARPRYSILISPRGISDSLRTLITSFGRRDILEYTTGREIALAKWDEVKKDIDYMSVIPSGWSLRI